MLDIGSGLGGVTRTIAEEAKANVTGIDLTQEFCDAAKTISDWVGLNEQTTFIQGDATKLPFPDSSFDGAVTVHVAMNIPDKLSVYKEVRRVLKPGARFGIYDILQGEGGDVVYPTPWAMDASISYLATPKEMVSLLQDAGFRILDEEDLRLKAMSGLELEFRSQNPTAPCRLRHRYYLGTSPVIWFRTNFWLWMNVEC